MNVNTRQANWCQAGREHVLGAATCSKAVWCLSRNKRFEGTLEGHGKHDSACVCSPFCDTLGLNLLIHITRHYETFIFVLLLNYWLVSKSNRNIPT